MGTWAGVAMSVGESKMSRYGGVSEFFWLLRSISGEVAATEASFDRKGSLGLTGGMGILVLFTEHRVLILRRLSEGDEDEEHGSEEDNGTRKQLAIPLL